MTDLPPTESVSAGDISLRDEVELMVRLRSGDPDALSALYDRFGKVVFSLASRMLADQRESEEVTQDVFLAVWKKPGAYHPERASPLTWLATLTRNKCIDRMRKAGRRVATTLEGPEMPAVKDEWTGSNPFLMSALGDLSRQIHSCLSRLSNSQRQAVESAYFDSLTMTEIAEKFSVPSGTVKSRLRLAIDRLRNCLSAHTEE